MRRFADGALALEAYFEDELPPAPPVARTLAGQLVTTSRPRYSACSPSVLSQQQRASTGRPLVCRRLRETQQELAALVGPAVPVAEETNRMVNSLAIAAHLLEAHATDVDRSRTSPAVGAVAA